MKKKYFWLKIEILEGLNNRIISSLCKLLLIMQNKINILILFLLVKSFCIEINIYGQTDDNRTLIFYNVENLFDIQDDQKTKDEEFTPAGEKKWSYFKLSKKLDHISRTIMYASDWEPPLLIGLCEVENNAVLQMLIERDPLNKYDYQIIHYDSPDERGIDVALLYLDDQIKLIDSKPLDIYLDGSDYTRDILYAKFLIKTEVIHVFINHWSSRSGGKSSSDWKRMKSSDKLKHFCDSLLVIDPLSKLLIMGDLNDEPGDESVLNLTKVA